jgi:ferredoxin
MLDILDMKKAWATKRIIKIGVGLSPQLDFGAQYNQGMAATDTPLFYTAVVEPGAQQVDAWTNQPLLMSLEQGGVDWPSSCRNGTCRTCIAQLVEGEVRYEIDWPGLSAEE